jgi:serine/threonine protein kinase
MDETTHNKTLPHGASLKNGEYRIVKLLGQGGFGITYEAEQVNLRRKVALKEFFMKDCCERDESSSQVTVGTGSQRQLVEKFRGKFIREAQMIASMDHSNIVRVIDVFEENGTAYYVMDNLPGGSLAEKVKKQGPLPEAVAEKYIRQVADALAYIHEQNTVHLDVKPSNILLNAKGNAVLIDFGISKHYDDSGEQTSSTPVGISKGYAPLEQGRDGDVAQFKPSTDIYALGATLYFLVTGQVPPEASFVYEDGLDRPIGVSDKIWQAIAQAMEPKRKDRPQDIASFLNLLGEAPVADSKATRKQEPLDDETVIEDIHPLGKEASSDGHKWVDLGLPSGLKWATCNLGATSPEEYGDYFAWGEVTAKGEYSTYNYRFQSRLNWIGEIKTLTKYNTRHQYGPIDGNDRLDPEDDAATVRWGKKWRMPREEDFKELLKYCSFVYTEKNGIKGQTITSKKNGNSVFIPNAGYIGNGQFCFRGSIGYYWSASLMSDYPNNACTLYFDTDNTSLENHFRHLGLPIRPVTE